MTLHLYFNFILLKVNIENACHSFWIFIIIKEFKSNIYSPFNSASGVHQLLRVISGSSAAKFASMFTSKFTCLSFCSIVMGFVELLHRTQQPVVAKNDIMRAETVRQMVKSSAMKPKQCGAGVDCSSTLLGVILCGCLLFINLLIAASLMFNLVLMTCANFS